VLASKLLAQAALLKGLPVRTAETIGMAQRGGSVFGHVRIGPSVSPLINQGGCDILIGFEPTETLRALPYLKIGGTVITAIHPIDPPQLARHAQTRAALTPAATTVLATNPNPLPDSSTNLTATNPSTLSNSNPNPLPLDQLRAQAANGRIGVLVEVDGDTLCARLGSTRILNVALIGAMLSTNPPLLDLAALTTALDRLVKPQYRSLNHQALKAGVEQTWR
jgi:indolepyruvate ferredoxin oxidoreductase beta subunit